MHHPVCNQQICENLFHYLPSSVYVIYRFVKICLHLITILRIYIRVSLQEPVRFLSQVHIDYFMSTVNVIFLDLFLYKFFRCRQESVSLIFILLEI